MQCQECKKCKATVRVSEMQSDGTHKEIHLCEECARQYGISLKFSFNEVLGNLISSQLGVPTQDAHAKCSNCGLTFDEFQSSGRLGCPHDYETFKANLMPMIERVQSGLRHVGKAPHNVGRVYAREQEIVRMQKDLDSAIAREDYEKAASIRDQIHKLRETPQSTDDELPRQNKEEERS